MRIIIYSFIFVLSFGLVNAAITDNMAAYWKLDENSGASTNDEVSTNDGTITNAAWTTGKLNSGLSFDGNTDYVTHGAVLGVTEESDFTITMWIYPTNVATRSTIVTQPAGTNIYGYIFDMGNTANKLRAIGQESGANAYLSDFNRSFSNNNWYFIAIVQSGSTGYVKLYVNGVYDSQLSITGLDTTSSTSAMTFSRNHASYAWRGKIDEPGFWTRALSKTEIQTIYNGGTGVQYPFSVGVTTPTFIGVADGNPYSIENVCNIMGVSSC